MTTDNETAFRGMKVLIVGGTSSIGKELVKTIPSTADVITSGRQGSDVRIDLKDDKKNMVIPTGVHTIVLTAANFGGKSGDEILDAEEVNVLGTLKVCQAAHKAGVQHVVFVSSIFALLSSDSNYYSIYALSKKHAEEVLDHYCRAVSLPLTILRPSQIYGNIDRLDLRQPFLYKMIECAQQDEYVNIFGSHDARINLINIHDVANVIVKVIELKITGTYSCISLENTSYWQFATAAFKAFGRSPKIRFVKEKNDLKDNIFDIDDTLYRKINYYPQVSLGEGLGEIAKSKTPKQ